MTIYLQHNVMILCSYVSIYTTDYFIVAPSITLSEEEEKVIEGDSITCTATSHPAPDVVWLNNDESVVDKDRLKTNHSMGVGNLSIVSVSMIIGRNDAGVYKCIAINSIGNDTRTINITVHCKELCNNC